MTSKSLLLVIFISAMLTINLTLSSCSTTGTDENPETVDDTADDDSADDSSDDDSGSVETPTPENVQVYGQVNNGVTALVVTWDKSYGVQPYKLTAYNVYTYDQAIGVIGEFGYSATTEYLKIIEDTDQKALIPGHTYSVSVSAIYQSTEDENDIVESNPSAIITVTPVAKYFTTQSLGTELKLDSEHSIRHMTLGDADNDGLDEIGTIIDTENEEDTMVAVYNDVGNSQSLLFQLSNSDHQYNISTQTPTGPVVSYYYNPMTLTFANVYDNNGSELFVAFDPTPTTDSDSENIDISGFKSKDKGFDEFFTENLLSDEKISMMFSGDVDGNGLDDLIIPIINPSTSKLTKTYIYSCESYSCAHIDSPIGTGVTSFKDGVINGAVTADIDSDGRDEVILVGKAIDSTSSSQPTTYGLVIYDDKISGFTEIHHDLKDIIINDVDVLNIDSDPELEIVVKTNSYAYIIDNDATNGLILRTEKISLESTSAYYMCTGNFDGDPMSEIAISKGMAISIYDDVINGFELIGSTTIESENATVIRDMSCGKVKSNGFDQIVVSTDAAGTKGDKIIIVSYQ